MRSPFISRRRHEQAFEKQRRGYEFLLKEVAAENSWARQKLAHELSTAKDVVASHIVAAGHPSTVLHDVCSFAESLQQALMDAGVDIRIELARLEGADL